MSLPNNAPTPLLLLLLLALWSGGLTACEARAPRGGAQAEDEAEADAGRDDAGEDDAGEDDAGEDDATNNTPSCTPAEEVCDGEDNDCDGALDEGIARSCGVEVGACVAGLERCEAGSWGACDAPLLPGDAAEVCDGVDNNCDGDTDEGCDCVNGAERSCLQGLCGGVEVCEAGAWSGCVPEVPPAPEEACDGEDRDCDGAVDEGCACSGAETQGCLVGLCEGIQGCAGGAWATCTPIGPPGDEACNGEDDDCDGSVDEGVVRVCGSAEGSCQEGEERCQDGVWGECQGDIPPRPESCDGVDSNCNGRVDDVAAELGEAVSTFPSSTLLAVWLDAPGVATYSVISSQAYIKRINALTGEVEATSPALNTSAQIVDASLVSSEGIVALLLGINNSRTGDVHWRLIQLDSQAQPITETEVLVSERGDGGASLAVQGDYFVAAVTDRYDSGTELDAQLIWVHRSTGTIAGRHTLPRFKSVDLYGHDAGVWVRGTTSSGFGGSSEVVSSYVAASPDATPSLVPGAVGDDARCLFTAPTPEGFATLSVRHVYNTPARAWDAQVSFQSASIQGLPLGPPRLIATERGNQLSCGDQPLRLEPYGEGFLASWAPQGPSNLGYVNPQGALQASASALLPREFRLLALRVEPTQQVQLVQRYYNSGNTDVTFRQGFPLACGIPGWEPQPIDDPCTPGALDRCPSGTWCAPTRQRCVRAQPPVLDQARITEQPTPSAVILEVLGHHVFQGLASFEVTRLDANQQVVSTTTERVDASFNPLALAWDDDAFTATQLYVFSPAGTTALSIVAIDTLGYRSEPLTLALEE